MWKKLANKHELPSKSQQILAAFPFIKVGPTLLVGITFLYFWLLICIIAARTAIVAASMMMIDDCNNKLVAVVVVVVMTMLVDMESSPERESSRSKMLVWDVLTQLLSLLQALL